MSKIISYAFINAKVHGMQKGLLTKATMDALLGARNFEDALRLLEQTDHPFTRFDWRKETPSAITVERRLWEVFQEHISNLAKFIPRIMKRIFENWQGVFEAQIARSLIRLWLAEVPIEEIWETIVPMGKYDEESIREIYQISKIEDLLLHLDKFKPWFGTHTELLKKYSDTKNEMILEQAINEKAYKELGKAAKKLHGDDKKYGGDLILAEIDFLNILTLVSILQRDIPKDERSAYLMGVYGKIDADTIKTLRESGDLEALFKGLRKTKYRRVVDLIIKEKGQVWDLIRIEKILNQFQLKKFYKAFYGKQLHLGVILAFMNLKKVETYNLRAILIGKIDDLPPSEIQEFLIQ
ncbi:MAG: V-type ATPase subunit [Candidatus Ranarchaeia archaeon]|jgi:vacuolar-type H+-ATPase subunit C/Vma6